MLRFRLLGDLPIDLYKPAGHTDSLLVEPGQTVDVPGALVTSRPEPKKNESPAAPLPEDAYTVRAGDEETLWPRALWELVDDKPAAKTAAVKEN